MAARAARRRHAAQRRYLGRLASTSRRSDTYCRPPVPFSVARRGCCRGRPTDSPTAKQTSPSDSRGCISCATNADRPLKPFRRSTGAPYANTRTMRVSPITFSSLPATTGGGLPTRPGCGGIGPRPSSVHRTDLRQAAAGEDSTVSGDAGTSADLREAVDRRHTVLYCGALSSHAACRKDLVPTPIAVVAQDDPKRKSKYIRWSELLPS
jgi:hypothetical protein